MTARGPLRRVVCLAGGAAVAGLMGGVHATPLQRPQASPAQIESWDAAQFAKALAKRGVVVGLVGPRADVFPPFRGKAPDAPDLGDAPVAGLVQSFNAGHTEFVAAVLPSGAVRISASWAGACEAVLQREETFGASAPLFETIYQVYRTWTAATDAYIPPGIVGSTLSQPGDPPPHEPPAFVTRVRQPVSLSGRVATLGDVLDSLVTQVPGTGWALEQRPASRATDGRMECVLGLFGADGSLTTGWVIPAVSPR